MPGSLMLKRGLLVLVSAAVCAGRRLDDDTTSALKADTSSNGGQELDERRACENKMKRLEELHDQDLTKDVGKDPYFLPEQSSIGPVEASCGEEKQSCAHFNVWKTFQQVAEDNNKKFKVFGKGLAKASDIQQGLLGDCYFLAAIASIIFSGHKEVIESMFTDVHLWDDDVYKTRWLLGGRESVISVDNMVPADDRGVLFGNMGPDGEFWPVILEKAWAKIFSSYSDAEGGTWREVVAAITRAPVTRAFHNENDAEAIWKVLTTATTQGFPVGAASDDDAPDFGLSEHHTYAVLAVKAGGSKGDRVRLYNPWRRHFYKGALKNKPTKDGTFWMLFTEYMKAFECTSYASVRTGHSVQQIAAVFVSSNPVMGGAALAVTTTRAAPFVVSVTWPSERMVTPCKLPVPQLTFALAPEVDGHPGEPKIGEYKGNSAVIEVLDPVPGKYFIFVYAHFPKVDYVDAVHLTVYGDEKAGIRLSNVAEATRVGMQMFGPVDEKGLPCQTVVHQKLGAFSLDQGKLVAGLPTYTSLGDGGKDLLYRTPWEKDWLYTETTDYKEVSEDFLITRLRIPGGSTDIKKDEFSCTCSDTAGTIHGYPAHCNEVYLPSGKPAHNVHCDDEEAGPWVRRYCPVLCGLGVGNCPTTTTTTTTVPLPKSADGLPCEHVVAKGHGLFILRSDKPALGHATYWSYDKENFIYFYEEEPQFLVAGSSDWAGVTASKPVLAFTASLKKDDLQCGCHDAEGDLPGFDDVVCAEASDRRPKFSNVKCSAEQYGAYVRRMCPVTCRVC